jgi:hypothetical protein
MKHSDFFSNFFVVEDPDFKKNYRGQIVKESDSTLRLLRADYKTEHLDIKHLEGSNEPSSLFWNMVNEPFCVNHALVDTFREANITGWTVTPTTVLTKLGEKTLDNYFAVSVTGRTNVIDYLKTDIVFKQFPGGQFPHFKGLYFDPESWDGTDIFMARPDIEGQSSAFIYVTKKFVDIFNNNKVKNIGFVNFNDYITDCGMVKICATDKMKREIDEKIKKASP